MKENQRILTCKKCGKKVKVSGYKCDNDKEYLCALCR